MTAEKQYVDDYASAYQGKTWSIFSVIGIMALVCIAMAVRDIGMVAVYGSIFDKIALDGVNKVSVSFMNYVFMVLLYLIPLVVPAIIRLTGSAYDNEPEASILPTFNSKILNIIMYVVVVAIAIIPTVLCIVGVFTSAYMFVALNIALLVFTSVTIFQYFNTYLLQRARKGLVAKYVLSFVAMGIVTAISAVITAVVVLPMNLISTSVPAIGELLGKVGANFSLVGHMGRFIENWNTFGFLTETLGDLIPLMNLADFALKGLSMLCTVAIALVVAGLLYHLTQNIIYASIPSVVLSFANVMIIQRITEAFKFFNTDIPKIAEYTEKLNATTDPKKIADFESKIAEIESNIVPEVLSMGLSYILMGCICVVLVAIAVYAIVRLIMNIVEAKKARKA